MTVKILKTDFLHYCRGQKNEKKVVSGLSKDQP